MKPVAGDNPYRNINTTASIAVGKRGIKPAARYSVMRGNLMIRQMAAKTSATSEKNLSGR
jgi:hypothetical protein